MTPDEIVSSVRKYPVPHHITLTGGEPLMQAESNELVRVLSKIAPVRIETNGSIDISGTDGAAVRIVDVKTPSSGECGSFLMSNLDHLRDDDEMKFVVGTEEDMRFTADFITRHFKDSRIVINISPSEGVITAAQCADFILGGGFNVRMNLQLHKIIWPEGELK